jgi:hypothetical protein
MKNFFLYCLLGIVALYSSSAQMMPGSDISFKFTAAPEFEGGDIADMVMIHGRPIASVWYGYTYTHLDSTRGWQPTFPVRFLALGALGNIAVGKLDRGIYLSRDTGKTWQQTPSPPPPQLLSFTPLVTAQNIMILYAVNIRNNNAIALSADTGATWQTVRVTTGSLRCSPKAGQ